MINAYWDTFDKRFCFEWVTEELEGNDGPITEQLYALMMGWC